MKFETVSADDEFNEKINQAYKDKYGGSPYLAPMIKEGPISATVKILPES